MEVEVQESYLITGYGYPSKSGIESIEDVRRLRDVSVATQKVLQAAVVLP